MNGVLHFNNFQKSGTEAPTCGSERETKFSLLTPTCLTAVQFPASLIFSLVALTTSEGDFFFLPSDRRKNFPKTHSFQTECKAMQRSIEYCVRL